jgi:hypothetical protein
LSDGSLSQQEIDALLAGVDSSSTTRLGSSYEGEYGISTSSKAPPPSDPFEKFVLEKIQDIEKVVGRLVDLKELVSRLADDVESLKRAKSEDDVRNEKFKEAMNQFMLPE